MRSPETEQHSYVVGRTYAKRGDITVLAAIAGQSQQAIERRLGFHRGRLANGYSLLVLVEKVAITDFLWTDQTRYSGGNQLYRDEGMMVPRRDLLRGALLVQHGSDDAADAAMWSILGTSQHRINIGVDTRTIIKVMPNIAHSETMPSHLQYPDADTGNIPQWTLTRAKTMECVANVHPGAIYRG
jgi:hypothetical protein